MPKLRKIEVAPGVAWVEAPEAGLAVLCGCPCDVVKHLMGRGIIVQTERQGVTYETGPNAILLSDVMLQNGAFCNLAEFPVLQMLYRQGMLLPGHPNNRGRKPVLIGLPGQLEAQMHYIYRGAYGLVNRKELLAAGASAEMADEWLAMKRHFAFGRIPHPRELLETIPLGEEPVALKGGVMLRRLALNVFEFSLGDEVVAVDLNLPPGVTYEPPYQLEAQRLDREYFAVVHAGDGDGWDPGRPCTGSVLMFQGRVYLVDAGPNLQHTLKALGIGVNEIEGLFHTHCHDDHFAGLTVLLRGERRIKYFATPLVRSTVMKKLSALLSISEASLAEFFDMRHLVFDAWNDVDGLEVKPLFSPHPVETNVFIFRAPWENGYRSYGHFSDIVSLDRLSQMVAAPDRSGISRRFHDKVVFDYGTPTDIKKLDVGGGLIHGSAEDFRDDASSRIIFAHLGRPLARSEKDIGSEAPFGTVDVLIRANQDYLRRDAHAFLRGYFPRIPDYELGSLLNSPVVVCTPGTVLLGEGDTVTSVHLILTGMVEMTDAASTVAGQLSAGGIIGEVAGIEGCLAGATYRASSTVRALKVGVGVYRDFVRRNGLLGEVMAVDERRNFLRSTSLCAEALSETTLTRLAKGMPEACFTAGQTIDNQGALVLVKSGRAELVLGSDAVEVLGRGDFFGEESALFDRPGVFRARALEPIEVCLCSPELVGDVPALRWKLLEIFERRMSRG